MNLKDLPVWAQILIAAAVVVGLVIAVHVMYIAPKKVEINKLTEDLTTLQADNNKLAQIEQRMPELEAEIKRLEDRLTVVIQILPTAIETDILVNKIKSIADNYHIQIVSISPKPLAPRGIYSEFAMTFKMRGTYHSLAYFFDKLSKMERIVHVSTLNLKKLAKKN